METEYAKNSIGTKLEAQIAVDGDAVAFREIYGLANVDFTKPETPQTQFDFLSGRNEARAGSVQARTLTGQMASAIPSPVYQVLLKAHEAGTPLTFRYTTSPATTIWDSGTGRIAIAADGTLTFSVGNYPNFGGDEVGIYAVGHAIQTPAPDNGLYRIKSIATGTNAWNGVVKVNKPSAPVAASAYQIVNPSASTVFTATITQMSNISSSPTAAVDTDTFSLVVSSSTLTWTFAGVS